MSIIVVLSSIYFFFPFFSFLELSIMNLKPPYFQFKKEILITFLFRKLTKVSTNNFKIDINGISDPLEICKIY